MGTKILRFEPFGDGVEKVDRVSSLPDEVLCHVLSFLTTKEAALTSVFSKRWCDLFTRVPNLDIEFLYPKEDERERVIQSFVDFTDRVLALQGDSFPIKKVTLNDQDVKSGVGSDRVNGWIRTVLQRGVSELEFLFELQPQLNGRDVYQLPPEIFVSKTLTKLKIKRGFDISWQVLGISLPKLKHLSLSSIGFHVVQFEMLLPACPKLERLDLHFINWRNSNVTVSSASLKKLLVMSYSDGCSLAYSNPKSLSFDTPNLVYLLYHYPVVNDYPIVNLTNLIVASLSFKVSEDHIERIRAPDFHLLKDAIFLRFSNVWKLISGIRNVRELYLTSNTLEVLSMCCESMPVFNNLKLLCIWNSENRGWQAMPVLLKNCPHLEIIVFHGLLHHVTDKCGDACDCVSREDKGRSLTSCPVKKLYIKGIQGTSRELGMIKHFLVSFPCLKVMPIYIQEKGPTDFEIPGVLKLVKDKLKLYRKFEDKLKLYRKLSSCVVKLVMPSDPLYKK